MSERTHRPPEIGLSRLEIRDPVTQGRLAWGYISDDEALIMSDTGDVWVRYGPKEVFGSVENAEDFIQERRFMPPPNKLPNSPYGRVPFRESVMSAIANKVLHHSTTSRLARWLLASNYSDAET